MTPIIHNYIYNITFYYLLLLLTQMLVRLTECPKIFTKIYERQIQRVAELMHVANKNLTTNTSQNCINSQRLSAFNMRA